MEDYINKFRFFIPPVFLLIFVFWFNPARFSDILWQLSFGGEVDAISTLFGGSLLILAVGFIISSLGAFVINLLGWTISKEDRRRIFYINQSDIARIEFKNWKNVAKSSREYIRNQIDKRWQMFVVNLNMCITFLLIFISWFISEYRFDQGVGALLIFLFIVLILNSISTYSSVHSLDKRASQ